MQPTAEQVVGAGQAASAGPALPALPPKLPLRWFAQFAVQERVFIGVLGLAFVLVGATYQHADVARWVGFFFAGYAVVGNDSIQTIGTFITSNERSRWWVLWLFIAGIFVVTVTYSWLVYDGDVSFQRLTHKGFAATPRSFSYLQVAAPLFLLILTRMRIPVSTSILLLTSFATDTQGVGSILTKSLFGYVVAFGAAIALWMVLSRAMARWFQGEADPKWRVAQWITSGALWSVWIMQDAANVAVYLPRSMNIWEFLAFVAVIVAGLALLFYCRGERVQTIVREKSDVVDVRPATIIDLVYAVVIFGFKEVSNVPMSTTWVFIGLLGGRELAMAWRRTSDRDPGAASALIFRDIGYAAVGLAVSLVIAISVNEGIRDSLTAWIGG